MDGNNSEETTTETQIEEVKVSDESEGESDFADIYSRLDASIELCRSTRISETVEQIIRGQSIRIESWSEVVALLEDLLSRYRHQSFTPKKEWFSGTFDFSDNSQDTRHLFYCSMVALRVVFYFMSGVLEGLQTDYQKIEKIIEGYEKELESQSLEWSALNNLSEVCLTICRTQLIRINDAKDFINTVWISTNNDNFRVFITNTLEWCLSLENYHDVPEWFTDTMLTVIKENYYHNDNVSGMESNCFINPSTHTCEQSVSSIHGENNSEMYQNDPLHQIVFTYLLYTIKSDVCPSVYQRLSCLKILRKGLMDAIITWTNNVDSSICTSKQYPWDWFNLDITATLPDKLIRLLVDFDYISEYDRMPERYDLRHILFTLVHSVPFKTYFKGWGSDLDRKTLIQFDARTMDDFHNVMEQLFSVVQSIREKESKLGLIINEDENGYASDASDASGEGVTTETTPPSTMTAQILASLADTDNEDEDDISLDGRDSDVSESSEDSESDDRDDRDISVPTPHQILGRLERSALTREIDSLYSRLSILSKLVTETLLFCCYQNQKGWFNLQPEILEKLSICLNYMIYRLTGHKSKECRLFRKIHRDPNDDQIQDFRPLDWLALVCQLYGSIDRKVKEQFDGQPSPLYPIIAKDQRSFSVDGFMIWHKTLWTHLSRINVSGWNTWINKWSIVMNKNGFGEYHEGGVETLDYLGNIFIPEIKRYVDSVVDYDKYDPPSDLCDPLLMTLMKDPVKLPNGAVWMDREVIQKHLTDQSSDPFTRTPLTIDDITKENMKSGVSEERANIIDRINIWKNKVTSGV